MNIPITFQLRYIFLTLKPKRFESGSLNTNLKHDMYIHVYKCVCIFVLPQVKIMELPHLKDVRFSFSLFFLGGFFLIPDKTQNFFL